ncbi:MAG TPA: NAD(P)-dependent oxidoreductase [Caulobacterales bacterium]|nr:NAD(P)-dependent oxidoreductase [Caulobacterales bacterium]
MAERMLKFVSVDQQGPEKRPAKARKGDYHEVYREFIAEKAAEQSARCSQCGVPFCQSHCPLQNNIPDWLRLTAEGRLEEAYQVSAATNSMPEVCGRICPQDRLCEGNCVIEQSGHGTVTIGAVEKYLTDTAWEKGWVPPIAPPRERSQGVGIIGAGPAGLAAAESLRLRGYQVTVYDRHDRAGGLLIYGIPNFKLEKDVVERRVKRLEDGGVKFVLNCNVGETVSFEELQSRHDALLIATGCYAARPLNAPNGGDKHTVKALDYLIASNRVGLGDEVAEFTDGTLNASGRRVVVIGGGDTAMDCVRTATRQGAKSVTCLYRRDRANMPGSQREVANAEEEGVLFDWLAAPKALRGGAKASGVKAVRMRLGAPDASGRQAPEEVPESEYNVAADLIIAALGFDPENLPQAWEAPNLKTTRWGAVRVDHKTMGTSIGGVYAAGDVVRGASLVVWAIREGRDAADAMHLYLQERAAASRVAAE